MRTVVKDEKSEWKKEKSSTTGISFGINNVLSLCKWHDTVSSYKSLFSNHAKLMRKIRNHKDCEKLQNDINKINEWSMTLEVEFNAEKKKSCIGNGKHWIHYVNYVSLHIHINIIQAVIIKIYLFFQVFRAFLGVHQSEKFDNPELAISAAFEIIKLSIYNLLVNILFFSYESSCLISISSLISIQGSHGHSFQKGIHNQYFFLDIFLWLIIGFNLDGLSTLILIFSVTHWIIVLHRQSQ